jgi:putative polyhydroxyalkanoate system protein
MSKPLTVTIPHQLGRPEAKKRIDEGIDRFAQQFGSGARFDKAWVGDKLDFTVHAMGQAITGALDVVDDAVHMTVDLPGILGLMAGKIKGKLQQEGQILLEKK